MPNHKQARHQKSMPSGAFSSDPAMSLSDHHPTTNPSRLTPQTGFSIDCRRRQDANIRLASLGRGRSMLLSQGDSDAFARAPDTPFYIVSEREPAPAPLHDESIARDDHDHASCDVAWMGSMFDSTFVERGSPTFSQTSFEGGEEVLSMNPIQDRVSTMTAARSSMQKPILPLGRDQGNINHVPDHVDHQSHRFGRPHTVKTVSPSSTKPSYPAYVPDNDLWGDHPHRPTAPGLGRLPQRQPRSAGSRISRRGKNKEKNLVDDDFVLLSPSDAEEEWTEFGSPEEF